MSSTLFLFGDFNVTTWKKQLIQLLISLNVLGALQLSSEADKLGNRP